MIFKTILRRLRHFFDWVDLPPPALSSPGLTGRSSNHRPGDTRFRADGSGCAGYDAIETEIAILTDAPRQFQA
jgi:hypothetical protein